MLNDISKEKKYALYMGALRRNKQRYSNNPDQDPFPVMKCLIVYGVKAINLKPGLMVIAHQDTEYNFALAECIKDAMALLTPGEFMSLFPITKEFHDDPGWKNYFTVTEYIRSLPQDKVIGKEIDNFLWEYLNDEIQMFMVKLIGFASDIRRLEGHPDIMEQFCEENGIVTYTEHQDESGRKSLIDNRTRKTAKAMPKRHLKIVK